MTSNAPVGGTVQVPHSTEIVNIDQSQDPSTSSDKSSSSDVPPLSSKQKSVPTPARDKLEGEIKQLYTQIDDLERFKNSGLATLENIKQIKSCQDLLKEKKKKLNIKKGDAAQTKN